MEMLIVILCALFINGLVTLGAYLVFRRRSLKKTRSENMSTSSIVEKMNSEWTTGMKEKLQRTKKEKSDDSDL